MERRQHDPATPLVRARAAVHGTSAVVREVMASITTRLLLTTVLVLLVGIGGTALGTRQVLLSRVDERIGDQLVQEIEELRLFAEQGLDPSTGETFGTDAARLLTVYVERSVPREGELIVGYLGGRPALRTLQAVPYRIHLDERATTALGRVDTTRRGSLPTPAGPFEYLAVPVLDTEADGPDAVFLVGAFRDVVAPEVDSTVRVTALVALLALVLGLAVAIGLARRILRPLARVTAAADELTDSDLSRRLDAQGHDEVARLARTFNAMLDRLQTAFATQREFVDDAGHELRTPITIIRGHLELLESDDSPAERAATIALVMDELARMTRIVDDLLTLARSDQPDFVQPEPFDVDELTTSVLRKASRLSTDHTWRLDRVAVAQAVGDEQRLTQALVQLAHNATRHTPPGTVVSIGSAVEDDRLTLWVEDDGPGVPRDQRERVFDRFSRGRDRSRRSEGAGLGLAIVGAIAAAHGGAVAVRDAPGGGALFELVLPAGRVPTRPPTPAGTP